MTNEVEAKVTTAVLGVKIDYLTVTVEDAVEEMKDQTKRTVDVEKCIAVLNTDLENLDKKVDDVNERNKKYNNLQCFPHFTTRTKSKPFSGIVVLSISLKKVESGSIRISPAAIKSTLKLPAVIEPEKPSTFRHPISKINREESCVVTTYDII